MTKSYTTRALHFMPGRVLVWNKKRDCETHRMTVVGITRISPPVRLSVRCVSRAVSTFFLNQDVKDCRLL